MYLSTPSIHGLPSTLKHTLTVLFFSSFFSFASLLMHSPVHTKNSNAYSSTCIINIALKLLSEVS